ncbi:MAG TPA: hypothetical protein VFX30_12595 [bacterium]|nr:hypothetical protein [bacterium]
MRTNPVVRWGIALAVIGGLLASGLAFGDEAKEDCALNAGVCGCSYGRVLCCDGSYAAQRFTKDGKVEQNACMETISGASVQPRAAPLPTYHTPTKSSRFLAPSQEIYWRGSIFDR